MNDEKKNQNLENEKRNLTTDQRTPNVDPALNAATHGTENARPMHPGHAEEPVEATGRKSDTSWKEK